MPARTAESFSELWDAVIQAALVKLQSGDHTAADLQAAVQILKLAEAKALPESNTSVAAEAVDALEREFRDATDPSRPSNTIPFRTATT